MTGARGGFTLVEIMVVIVVLTILTATIVPEFSGTLEDARLRASGRKLAAAIRFAASEAVTRSRVLRLHVNPTNGDYWLEAENERQEFQPLKEDGRGRLDERIAVDIVPIRPVIMGGESETPPPPTRDEGPEAAGLPGVIRFYPDGTADGREVVLRSSAREGEDGVLLRLVVSPTTSRVRVSDSRESDSLEGRQP
jgi:prepilin-type N-terminal cleavage/methylation domain-containing protein